MDSREIETYLNRPSSLLAARDVVGEIVLYGGAAVAETLCREASLPPPAWTDAPVCYLKKPWFAGGLETLKAILLAESPVPFRRRNLFVSANALARA